MSEQIEASSTSTDDMLIRTLRSCGFFVRQLGLLDGQRPQVMGTVDNATAFFKLAVTGADVGIAMAFAPYLKEGETPLQRLKREIKDSETLAAMLAEERAKVAALQVDAAAARRYGYLRDTPGMLPLEVWHALEGAGATTEGKFDQALYGADLDRAIDSALAATQKGCAA
ncbi:CubicO group peptidase (beta-lactamase class C family) [Duganella sp. 1224]|uniref:hypothetical protein n=1 Tax=Duganella sp. 1224 TaxID=2587052 RepID=UPI0015C6BE39|nr:hypothetical protein [Duganella sp. 1224]NYE62223.1 CubicO group peptidase (beta-lactamase class C family) [Duganella sp. 1224]